MGDKQCGKDNLLIFAATLAHSSFVTVLPWETVNKKKPSLL